MAVENNLEKFREELKMTKRAFAAVLGIHEGNYAKMERGQLSIGPATLIKFQKKFPKISNEWWAFDKGKKYIESVLQKEAQLAYKQWDRMNKEGGEPEDMIRNTQTWSALHDRVRNPAKTIQGEKLTQIGPGRYRLSHYFVPRYAADSYVKSVVAESKYSFNEYLKNEIIVSEIYNSEYKSFEMVGGAMYDGSIFSIPDGSVVTGRSLSIDDIRQHIFYDKILQWVFIHPERGIMIRQIKDFDYDKKELILQGLATDKEQHPDIIINPNDLLEAYGIINKVLPTSFYKNERDFIGN